MPAGLVDIDGDEDIAREQRRRHQFGSPRMGASFAIAGQIGMIPLVPHPRTRRKIDAHR